MNIDTTDYIFPPWTDEQVAALNDWQTRGTVHPFTCAKGHANNVLVARADGWHCPMVDCDYMQTWAHDFVAVSR